MARVNFNPLTLFAAAASQYGSGVLGPGQLVSDPLDAVSLGLSLMLGTAGLPAILMRFYTVPDAKTARESATYATAFIGFFYLLTFVLSFGAMVWLDRTPSARLTLVATWRHRCSPKPSGERRFSASSRRSRLRPSWQSWRA